jgi:hypothetical protein
MSRTEYTVALTVDGKLDAWQTGAASFEQGLRMLSTGLVMAAQAIAEYPREDGSEQWLTDMCLTWWEDYSRLPSPAQRQTWSRLIAGGTPIPQKLNETVVEEV